MDEVNDPRKDAEPQDGRAANDITAPPSRSEVVRRALAAGFEAAADGVSYIRQEFGIVISPSLFLAAKATERKKGWARNGKPGRRPKKSAGEGGGTPTIGHQPESDDAPIDRLPWEGDGP